MSAKFKPPDGARSFILTIAISEEGDSAVQVEELGTPNRTVATVPKGEFGVREGLRVGGNLVREFYRNKQRELVLTERAAVVKRKREERIQERAGKALEARQVPKALEARQVPKAQPSEAIQPEPPLPPDNFAGDFGPNGDATTAGFFDPTLPDLEREAPDMLGKLRESVEEKYGKPEPPEPAPAPEASRSAGSVAAAALRRKGFGDFTGGKK